VHPLAVDGARRRAGALEWGLAWLLSCALALALHAQAAPATGPQQLTFAGLRAVLNSQGQPQGQINAVWVGATGNVYLLIDQKDGVRLIETDPSATNILNQAQIGAKGDVGVAMALDPAGNVYVTGTTTSGALTATGGAAFAAASGTATNSFVAKFSASLGSPIFVTFCGGGSMDASSIAASSDAVFITGGIYATTLPVTAAGIIQTPAFGSSWNGFCGEVFRVGQFPALCDVPERGKRQYHARGHRRRRRGRCVHRGDDDRAGLSHGCGAGAEPTGDDGAGHDLGLSDQADSGGRRDYVFHLYSRRGNQFAGHRCGGREPAAGGLDFAGAVPRGQRGYAADSYDVSGAAEDDAGREFCAGI